MDYFYSIVLAVVQGTTEFLPVSSSGHLIIIHQIFQSRLLNSLTFDVILHFGTLVALVIYFWNDLTSLVRNFFVSIFSKQHKVESQLSWYIIIALIPALLVGYFFEDFIEQKFRSTVVVIIMLVLVGILFIIFEKLSSKKRDLRSMTIIDALVIGLAQVLAFIPGTSRSGITIVAGLSKDFSRKEAARFTFLLAVPTIFIATIRRITQISLSDSSFDFVFVCILGTIFSAVVGYLAIKFFLKFVESRSLIAFAVYRFILAGVLLVVMFWSNKFN